MVLALNLVKRIRSSIRVSKKNSSKKTEDAKTSVIMEETLPDGEWMFLNYGDETKRILIPNDLKSVRDTRNLFYKVFSNSANLENLHNPNAKIYVQDQNRPEIFYELEDISDIKPKCVLKLHEHVKPAFTHPGSLSTNNVSKSMASLMNQQKADDLSSCASETASEPAYQKESQMQRYRTLERPGHSIQQTNRSKTMSMDLRMAPPTKPHLIYEQNNNNGSAVTSSRHGLKSYEKRDHSSGRNYANYLDNGPYSPFDRSCTTPSRSGSVTPIIDEEARARVVGMEKQLADLSSLVHMALMPSKGIGDTLHKDLEMLRREILGPSASSSFTSRDDGSDSSSLSRCSDLESDRGGYALSRDSCNNVSTHQQHRYYNGKSTNHKQNSSNPETAHSLKSLKRKTNEIQLEVKNLRRMVQVNSQTARDVLKDAFDRIRVILNTNQHLHMFADQAKHQNQKIRSGQDYDTTLFLKDDQEKHFAAIQQLERELSQFEKRVDDARDNVVSGTKRLKIDEVEEFTETLTNLIRAAANEKARFPTLQERLKEMMSLEMEKFVREEKFLKDEPQKLDNALRRCKKLTGTIITMKKLAMVQDPKGGKSRNNSEVNSPSKENLKDMIGSETLSNKVQQIEKQPQNGQKEIKFNGSLARTPPGKMLDGLLEQLNSVGSDITSNSGTIKKSPKSAQQQLTLDQNANEVILKSPTSNMNYYANMPNMAKNGPTDFTGSPLSNRKNGTLTRKNDFSSPYDRNNTNNIGNQILRNDQSISHVTLPNDQSNGHVTSPYNAQFINRSRAMSPRTILNTSEFTVAVPQNSPERPRSTTPSSNNPYAPQPPMRTTSRTMTSLTTIGQRPNYDWTIDNAGHFNHLAPKTPIIHTNAVDGEDFRLSRNGGGHNNFNNTPKLASSNESVNSQETMLLGHQYKKPPPPPPPPRNRQEMMEYRQHELNSKQLKYQLNSNGIRS